MQVDRRPHRQRQDDGARYRPGFRPAAKKKTAGQDFFRHRRCDAEGDHKQPERAVGLGRLQHVTHEAQHHGAAKQTRDAVPAEHSTASAIAPSKVAPRRPAQREVIGKGGAGRADRNPCRRQHGRQSHDHRQRDRQPAAHHMRGARYVVGATLPHQEKEITASWPTNMPANKNRPHSAVPQNFQIRGGRSAGVTTSGGLSGSRLSIKRLSIGVSVQRQGESGNHRPARPPLAAKSVHHSFE